MNKNKALDKKIEEWAERLADQSERNGDFDTDEVAAFKAVAGYYAASRKLTKSGDEEDHGGFANARRRVAEAAEQAPRSSEPAATTNGAAKNV